MPSLKKIVVQDFRNISFQELSFSPNVNCISGNNGEGKTNLLDAIYYLSMTKSAFSAPDAANFRYGTAGFTLGGTYAMENGLESRFALQVTREGKKLVWDDKPYSRMGEHIGVLPLVMVSPGDIALVSESGEERRRLSNAVLSQMDREYLAAIQAYGRLLAQRNKILKDPLPDASLLSVLDERMAAPAAAVRYLALRRPVGGMVSVRTPARQLALVAKTGTSANVRAVLTVAFIGSTPSMMATVGSITYTVTAAVRPATAPLWTRNAAVVLPTFVGTPEITSSLPSCRQERPLASVPESIFTVAASVALSSRGMRTSSIGT